MEKITEIKWSKKAVADLKKIYIFLLTQVLEEKAFLIIKIIKSSTNILYTFPLSGSVELNLIHLKKEYRKIISENYKILYSVNIDFINIHAVFDVRQNPNKMKIR